MGETRLMVAKIVKNLRIAISGNLTRKLKIGGPLNYNDLHSPEADRASEATPRVKILSEFI